MDEKKITTEQKHLEKVKIIIVREYEIKSFEDRTAQLVEAINNDGFADYDYVFTVLDEQPNDKSLNL